MGNICTQTYTEAVVRRCSVKVSCNFIKKRLAQVFSCEFCEISKNTFFTEPLRTTASICTQANIILAISSRSSRFRSVLRRCSENMQQIYRRTALQLYRNLTSAWVFFCKFVAYFQNTFFLGKPCF